MILGLLTTVFGADVLGRSWHDLGSFGVGLRRSVSHLDRDTSDVQQEVIRMSQGLDFLKILQGWNQWILALDVRKNGLGRQGGKFLGFS